MREADKLIGLRVCAVALASVYMNETCKLCLHREQSYVILVRLCTPK